MDTKEFLEKIKDLPTISSVANQINIESKKESLTAKSLSAIIARDPSLTSKVLKLANSAYYGLVKQVDTLDRAVTEFDTSFAFRLREREGNLIRKIEDALSRLEDGTFGICEECGEEISLGRLQARPITTLCIKCKDKQEVDEKIRGL